MGRYRVAPARAVCLSGAAAEIGIFTAERHLHVASQSGHTAATASSEASWNSRSGLLPSGGRHSAAVSRMKGGGGGGAGNGGGGGNKKPSQRWTLFGRKCPCAGRKAVAVDAASEPRSPAMDARFSAQSAVDECIESAIFKAKPRDGEPGRVKMTVRPGCRAFQLPSNDVVLAAPNRGFAAAIGCRAGRFAFPAAGRFTTSGALVDEPPRASLELFRPIDEDSVVLADPPPPPPPALPRGRDLAPRAPPPADEEAMSDASSELFELESFAASSSFCPTATSFLRGRGSRRNSADLPLPYAEPVLSECMYAPSEASVVWSVATPEGGAFDAANFSSAASACGADDVFRFVVPPSGSSAEFTASMSRGATGRKKGGGFLDSCRCEKAVSVGPTPLRMVRPPAHPAATKKGRGSAPRRHSGSVHVPCR